MLRSTLAVIAGFVLWTVLWLAANAVMTAAMPDSFNEDGISDDNAIMIVSILLSVVFSVLGGYTTAMVAKVNEMKPVVILAVLELVVGIIVEISYWDVIPVWYHVTFLVLLVPSIVFGGRMALKRKQGAVTAP